MEKLLFGDRHVDCRRHKFCDPQYRQRCAHSSTLRWVACINVLKDLQRYVLQRDVLLNHRARWYDHAAPLPRCLWICPWYYDSRFPCKTASDQLTGTSLICAFLEIFMSLVSPKVLQRIFPPMVTGTVILMIGASLVGTSGIPNWGGGSNDCRGRPETGFFQLCPNIAAPKPKLCVCLLWS